jgi:hypothetical protein
MAVHSPRAGPRVTPSLFNLPELAATARWSSNRTTAHLMSTISLNGRKGGSKRGSLSADRYFIGLASSVWTRSSVCSPITSAIGLVQCHSSRSRISTSKCLT